MRKFLQFAIMFLVAICFGQITFASARSPDKQTEKTQFTFIEQMKAELTRNAQNEFQLREISEQNDKYYLIDKRSYNPITPNAAPAFQNLPKRLNPARFNGNVSNRIRAEP